MKYFILIALIFLFYSCDDPFKTEKFYKEHPIEREKIIISCKKRNTMTETIKRNCQNANQAERKISPKIDLTKNYGDAY